MIIYTIGFTKKTAKEFFEKIKSNKIELLLDIRLNNISQLAGFAKGSDLEYFLKEICNCCYKHDISFAPSKELLDDYRKNKISWEEYGIKFNEMILKKEMLNKFTNKYLNYEKICLLCSEPEPKQCHRRLVAEYLKNNLNNVEIIHI